MMAVINNCYGGFGIDQEIADWLINNKSWKVISNEEYHSSKQHFEKTLVRYSSNFIYMSDRDIIKARSNKDFIECVKVLKEQHNKDMENMSYTQKRDFKSKHKVLELSVVEVTTHFGIEDYNDGYERVTSYIKEEEIC